MIDNAVGSDLGRNLGDKSGYDDQYFAKVGDDNQEQQNPLDVNQPHYQNGLNPLENYQSQYIPAQQTQDEAQHAYGQYKNITHHYKFDHSKLIKTSQECYIYQTPQNKVQSQYSKNQDTPQDDQQSQKPNQQPSH